MTWELALVFALAALLTLIVGQISLPGWLNWLMGVLFLVFAAAAVITGILWAVNA